MTKHIRTKFDEEVMRLHLDYDTLRAQLRIVGQKLEVAVRNQIRARREILEKGEDVADNPPK